MSERAATPTKQQRHGLVAGAIVGVIVLMGGLSFAAVPLYQIFCRMTGYGGTPQIASKQTSVRGERSTSVRFDANVAPGLPWTFSPEVSSVTVRNGETATIFYKVRNTSDRTVAANAVYNVSPDQAGSYFTKISCFCFEEQTLGPGESAEWPVVFYLDPALETDETMKRVEEVTLSYTFFASKRQPAVAQATKGAVN
jgi:cytochrome c oxidase assembly protein subunit 11